MQFERFHGLALLALGALLLLVQAAVIFGGRSSSAARAAASEQRAETESRPVVAQFRGLKYLSGVIGIAVTGVGVFALVQVHRRALEEGERSVRTGSHAVNRS